MLSIKSLEILFVFFFKALRMVGRDRTILILCLTVFLSYLPEAGEYSSLFVYLRLVSVKICIIQIIRFFYNNVLKLIQRNSY